MASIRRPYAVLAIPFALAACDLSSSLGNSNTLVGLGLAPVEFSNNTGSVEPVLQFARNAAFQLPNTAVPADQCQGPVAIDNSTGPGANLDDVDAGATISWEQGQTQEDLVKLVSGSDQQYVPSTAGGIPAQLGGLVTITIPGAADGFPAMTVVARLAENITGVGPINPAPAAGSGLLLQWDAVTVAQDSAKIEFLLQYNTGGGEPNQQIICRLNDDGTFTVDAVFLTGWRLAPDESKNVVITRYRSYFKTQGDAQFGFLSTHAITKTTFP
jgi:hypothetical protein